MSPVLRLELVGRSAAFIGPRCVRPSAERVFAGALLLGLGRGRKWTRQEFAAMLWPNAPESVQRSRLRWLLAKMRTLGLPLEPDAAELGLPRDAVSIDVDDVDISDGDGVFDVMPSYTPTFSREFSIWFDERRESLRSTLFRRMEASLRAARKSGDWRVVLTASQSMQRLNPSHEDSVLAGAEAMCHLGKKPEALAALKRYLESGSTSASDVRVRARSVIRHLETSSDVTRIREPIFVGRTEHLRRIELLLSDVRIGQGRSLILSGPPGIGKTRMLEEARTLAELAGVRTVRVRCNREDTNRPLSGLIDLVTQLLELRGAAGCDPDNLARLRRFASNTVEAPKGVDGSETPHWTRRRLVSALLDLLGAIGAEAPLLVEIDDAQWVDRSLSWLWRELLDWSQEHAVAWLFGFRTTHRSSPAFESPVVEIGALEMSQALELLQDWSRRLGRPLSREVSDSILARGAGSPMFIGELVRQWSDSGTLSALPMSLEGVIERGLTTMTLEALRVLQVAAIFGAYATVERIGHVASMPQPTFLDALTELSSAGILTADDHGIIQGHVLWAEAAIVRLPTAVAIVLHARAAKQFDAELAERPDAAVLWESARHWRAAGDRDRASRAIIAGAEHLEQNGFPSEAAEVLGRALVLSQNAHDKLAILRQRIAALRVAGEWLEARAEIDRHEELAIQLDPLYDLHNDLELWRIELRTSDREFNNWCLDAALRCARDVKADVSHRLAAARMASGCAERTDPEVLHELNAFALEVGKTKPREWDWLRIRSTFERRLGDQRLAQSLYEEMVGFARKSPRPIELPFALQYLGQSLAIAGRFAEARSAFEEGISIAKRRGFAHVAALCWDHLVGMTIDVDRVSARRLIEVATTVWDASDPGCSIYQTLAKPCHQANLAVIEGRFADALCLAKPLQECRDFRPLRARARLVAIHLAARIGLGDTSQCAELAECIRKALNTPDDWLDWPATVLASYLKDFEGRESAVRFSRHFVSRIRRELYPPPAILAELAAESLEVATELVAT